MKYCAIQSLGLSKVVLYLNRARLAAWPADFEGSEPMATAVELKERTLQKLNEKLGFQPIIGVTILSMGTYPNYG